jgi:hypothetical protein
MFHQFWQTPTPSGTQTWRAGKSSVPLKTSTPKIEYTHSIQWFIILFPFKIAV